MFRRDTRTFVNHIWRSFQWPPWLNWPSKRFFSVLLISGWFKLLVRISIHVRLILPLNVRFIQVHLSIFFWAFTAQFPLFSQSWATRRGSSPRGWGAWPACFPFSPNSYTFMKNMGFTSSGWWCYTWGHSTNLRTYQCFYSLFLGPKHCGLLLFRILNSNHRHDKHFILISHFPRRWRWDHIQFGATYGWWFIQVELGCHWATTVQRNLSSNANATNVNKWWQRIQGMAGFHQAFSRTKHHPLLTEFLIWTTSWMTTDNNSETQMRSTPNASSHPVSPLDGLSPGFDGEGTRAYHG